MPTGSRMPSMRVSPDDSHSRTHWPGTSPEETSAPLYHFTHEFAKLEPPPPQMQQLFGALRHNQEATNQFFAAISGSMRTFMNPENIGRIVAASGAGT